MNCVARILLVDHEPRVTRMVRKALEMSGDYIVRVEAKSESAVHAARWFRPDLILVDTLAASFDAEEIASRMHAAARLSGTPVMILSSCECDDEVMSRGSSRGYSFVAERVGIPELVRYVRELVSETETVRLAMAG